jgi:hypothetical protein
MKKNIILVACLIGILALQTILAQRLEININANWKFLLQDEPEAFNAEWDDSNWVKVNVPHDWAFEKGVSKNGAQTDRGGYFDGGIAWYRKYIDVPAGWDKKRILIELDGVYMNSEVWINGHYLGKRPYGYISFRYELSEFLKPGTNTIAVRVDNSQEAADRTPDPLGTSAHLGPLMENKTYKSYPDDEFITDIFTKEAIKYLKTEKGKPFFLTLSYNSVHHIIHEVPQKYLGKYGVDPIHNYEPDSMETFQKRKPGSYSPYYEKYTRTGAINDEDMRKFYLANLNCLDDNIGRVLDALKKKKWMKIL